MDRAWMHIEDRMRSNEYAEGVKKFIDMAKAHALGRDCIRCPCRRCRNRSFHPISMVEDHLFIVGIDTSYTEWIFHGEEETLQYTTSSDEEGIDDYSYNDYIDDVDEMLDYIRVGSFMDNSSSPEGEADRVPQGHTAHTPIPPNFDELLDDAKMPLYPNCSKFSKLSFIVKLLHIKTIGGWTVKSFDMVIKLHFLKHISLPHITRLANYNVVWALVTKRYMWASSTSTQHRLPKKVLRYFPLKPRLQRLFVSKKTAQVMRWHKTERVDDTTHMRHPTDSQVWKDFDRKHASFAEDPRNVRLGLASDGFNPFNNMSKPYSIWPVLLVPYNLPPWLCMKDPYLMMSLLIPGPKALGNDIDVFMRPLIDELIELWEERVRTYDAYKREFFVMRATLLWTINDFPAYANLSGWSTKGKMACPTCNAETDSLWLVHGRKHCYMGHRRWLEVDHSWRQKKNAFNGKEENRLQPKLITGHALLEQLNEVSDVQFGKSTSKKRKCLPNELNWTKRSIFFELPYWLDLGLRHNLDVMHIEKNICDNVLGTLINIDGKSKDTANARRDLEHLGLRKELHLQHDGERTSMQCACYVLNATERMSLCARLADVKFPDGFASNIARCVNISDGKILGMKSHDCHIFMQYLLPVVIGGFLLANVRRALIELCLFFKELCSRTLDKTVLERLQTNIPIILCKLEMILPPAFFDIMVHLAIHLPDEALLARPVQYRWMYPFERYMGKFKRYVRNRARPEGSIAEAYVHVECLTFCSMYLNDIETRHNREERNIDVGLCSQQPSLSVFSQKVHPLGGAKIMVLPDTMLSKAEWYVLNNCPEIEHYIDDHYNKMKEEGLSNFEHRHQSQFPSWFRARIAELHAMTPPEVTDDIYALACGPDPLVASYHGCIMNGIRFHSKKLETRRLTQNSGVVVYGNHQGNPVDYYGQLTEVIELRYMGWRKCFLFKCDWWDIGDKRRGIQVGDHFTSVNTSRQWYKDEPFALASQALQVFYIKDPTLGGSWHAVHKISTRNVYNIGHKSSEFHDDDDDDSSTVDVEDDSDTDVRNYGPVDENDGFLNPLTRVGEEQLPVDPSTISRSQLSPVGDDEDTDNDDVQNRDFLDGEHR
ncbi:uncharacterized protein LOC122306194 [Carya illinoinensis]|uniref:uncharacterized protein LOC122306194 n=1 Tax=Carya illinoinensis TaxID=32201 RepID=UPI001C724830|nr:uncharacterized protein LOC122306194 [Carya illinoinensis]